MKNHLVHDFERSSRDPIAIIGIGCRFPGSVYSPQDFWNLLTSGQDAIVPVPADRWDNESFYDPNTAKPGKTRVDQGGFLDKVDHFDAHFFGISPREADNLDPQQRILLEVAWDAMEDASLVPANLAGKDVGVFVGAFTLDYKLLQFQDREAVGTHTAVGAMMTMVSARLAYLFDLQGPCLSVDTACSSSLVSVHLACQALWNNECSMALAGGVNVMTTPDYTIAESKGGFLSPDGRSKAFDSRANGYVRGEGAGLVVLKPLAQAEADGDPIYAVIRGTAVNQDGRTKGITVPSQTSQEKLMRAAYERAGVRPTDVQYVEAHGTGTPVGDPIEASAISAVLGDGRPEEDKCIVGSCKTNIGHLEAAAGIAGLIKASLALKHRQIPPHLHFLNPNPEIPFDQLPIRIPTKLEQWPDVEGPALAGVNSFGFGGTNAHIVLQEAPEKQSTNNEQRATDNGQQIVSLPLSARSKEALRDLAESYRDAITQLNSDEKLNDLIFTTTQRRTHHDHRLTVSGRCREELVEQLDAFITDNAKLGQANGRVVPGKEQKLVFVYTGMGPQWWAMGRELLATEPVFRAAAEKCDAIFQKHAGWSILEAMLVDEEDSEMAETRVAQPANVVIQIGLTELWRSWGIEPDAIVGHSVGEIVSGYVSGKMSLDEAMQVAFHRSRLQQLTTGMGKMLAVGLPESEAKTLLHGIEDKVSIAAINSPSSVTLAGDEDALTALGEQLEANKIFNKMLWVKIPYHSPSMDMIKDELLDVLSNLTPKTAVFPLHCTVTGETAATDAFSNEYWWQNVRYPVRFARAIQNMAADGANLFLEIGPHPVLATSIKECLQHGGFEGDTIFSMRRKKDELLTIREALAELYVRGYDINWQAVNPAGQVAKLPAYPWQRERYWHESRDAAAIRLNERQHPLLGRRLSTPTPMWESEISTHHLPYLQDHAVQNAVLFPGAGYVELGLSAANAAYDSEQCILENVQFRSALFINENDSPQIQLQLNPADTSFNIYSRTLGNRENWQLNANGRLRQLSAAGIRRSVDLSSLLVACPEQLTSDVAYAEFSDKGFQYGPAFQGITNLWRGTYDAVGKLDCPTTTAGEESDYHIHPALLDASFQVMVAIDAFAAQNGSQAPKVFLPVGINRVRFYESPGTKAWAHAHIVTQNAERIVGDVTIFDENGRILVEIQGFTAQAVTDTQTVSTAELDSWLYDMAWTMQPRDDNGDSRQPAITEPGRFLLFADNNGTADSLATALTAAGHDCIMVSAGEHFTYLEKENHFQVDATSSTDMQKILDVAQGDGKRPFHAIIHLWALNAPAQTTTETLQMSQVQGPLAVMKIVQTIATLHSSPALWLVTRGAQPVTEDHDRLAPSQSSLWGLGRVIGHQEFVKAWGGLVDLDPTSPENEVSALLGDILNPDAEDQIAYRNQERYVVRLVHSNGRSANLPTQFRPDATYLITGGMGALGLLVAKWMVAQGARRLILMSRSALPPRTEWKNVQQDSPLFERITGIRELEAMGATIHLAAVDITNECDLVKYMAKFNAEGWPKVRGIVHSAGLVQDVLLTQMDEDIFSKVLAPKVLGGWVLHNTFKNSKLDFFVLFSSVASLVAQTGQGNYAAGNAFLDTLAYYRRAHGLPAVSINWGPWAVGMIKDLDLVEHYARRGMDSIAPEAGIQLLSRLFGFTEPQVGVLSANWPVVLEYYPRIPQQVKHLGEEAADADGSGQETLTLAEQLQQAEPDTQQGIVEDAILSLLARVLRMDKERLETTIPLNALGMDSLIATELRNRMEINLGIGVTVVELLQGPTVAQLAENGLGQLTAVSTEPSELVTLLDQDNLSAQEIEHVITADNNNDILSLLDNLDSLTEEEVQALLAK